MREKTESEMHAINGLDAESRTLPVGRRKTETTGGNQFFSASFNDRCCGPTTRTIETTDVLQLFLTKHIVYCFPHKVIPMNTFVARLDSLLVGDFWYQDEYTEIESMKSDNFVCSYED